MKYEPMDLWDFIEVESTITCSSCGKQKTAMGGSNEDSFFYEGWRATKSGNVYCPECALKKLKKVDKHKSIN